MKNLFIILGIILFGLSVNAEDIILPEIKLPSEEMVEESSEFTLKAEAVFDWVDISQLERDSKIQYYHDILFGEKAVQIQEKDAFKEKYDKFMKDENWKEHYRLAKLGATQTEKANLCAFFFKSDILLIYALQYKDNPRNVFYYNAYGRLQYVDDISDNYPNFPYNSKQYRRNGKLVSAIYFVSHDMQYMYEPDGEFKGLWYKEKMYDKNGKQTMTRSNWGT
ncbi:hypothetical protein IJZ97_05950 [bacterium]|nr:hypothetical protein [bacterium]